VLPSSQRNLAAFAARSKSLGSESVKSVQPGSRIWEVHKELVPSPSQEEH
jgi:hypothetical protein